MNYSKNVLITGGTGSLGQKLVEHMLEYGSVEKIIIYSRGEHKQEEMMLKYKEHKNYSKLRFFIGDIRDSSRLSYAAHDADCIIHAAALKVVPLMEANPFEAVKTNILGTQNVIDAAINNHVEKVMLVSTDKAVSPLNLYGATKLCAEKMILAANNVEGARGPVFSVVRYGNVANSNGSVIPLFSKLRKEGKMFPITDERMTRFFITLDDAAAFVLDKSVLSVEMEPKVYIPQMKSFDVIDLCGVFGEEKAFSLVDWPHEIVGIRPGEKLHECIDENTSSEFAERMSVQELREAIK
jgi:UDP-N-acetylglucosamine 4,6-dehydratase